jgi:hypothetical protein
MTSSRESAWPSPSFLRARAPWRRRELLPEETRTGGGSALAYAELRHSMPAGFSPFHWGRRSGRSLAWYARSFEDAVACLRDWGALRPLKVQ